MTLLSALRARCSFSARCWLPFALLIALDGSFAVFSHHASSFAFKSENLTEASLIPAQNQQTKKEQREQTRGNDRLAAQTIIIQSARCGGSGRP
jgi:hypothetical protein